jgi:hypothetical protein
MREPRKDTQSDGNHLLAYEDNRRTHRSRRGPRGSERQFKPLAETDLADVDANHQNVQDWPASRSTCVGAPFGRQMNAVRHGVVGSELGRGETGCNIDAVILATQSEVIIEVRNLEPDCAFRLTPESARAARVTFRCPRSRAPFSTATPSSASRGRQVGP